MPELLMIAAIGIFVIVCIGMGLVIYDLFIAPDREDGFSDEEEW